MVVKLSYRARVKGSRPGRDVLEVYFVHEPPDSPVYCFQHTMKTGGTSIRALIYSNLIDRADFDRHLVSKKHSDFRQVYGDFYRSLSDGQRSRLSWVISHSASFLVPLIERPTQPITIVREPVDRVLSRFWYPTSQPREITELTAAFDEMTTGRNKDRREQKTLSMSRRLDYSNQQSRCLLEPYYDTRRQLPVSCGPPPDADVWRERLRAVADTYILLRNDRLDEDFARVSRDWAWKVEQPVRMRGNPSRPRVEDLPAGLHERILAFNWLDAELHRCAFDQRERGASGTNPA